MSGDKTADIIAFAKDQLDIDLLPWQAGALNMVLNRDYSRLCLIPVARPARRGWMTR